jgi:hypothetical protein
MLTFRLPEIALSLSCELDRRLDALCVFGKVATFFYHGSETLTELAGQKLGDQFFLEKV